METLLLDLMFQTFRLDSLLRSYGMKQIKDTVLRRNPVRAEEIRTAG